MSRLGNVNRREAESVYGKLNLLADRLGNVIALDQVSGGVPDESNNAVGILVVGLA